MPRQMPRYGISRSRATLAGEDLPLPAARAEAARDEHAVDLLELARGLLVRHVLRVDPADANARAVVDARVLQRLVHGEVRVVQLHVLADERDLDLLVELAAALGQLAPLAEVGGRGVEPELLADERVEALAPAAPRGRGRRRGRRARDRRPRGSTSAKSAILSRMSSESGSVERQTTMSGWIPMRRSSFTECCVGFVFSSPGRRR